MQGGIFVGGCRSSNVPSLPSSDSRDFRLGDSFFAVFFAGAFFRVAFFDFAAIVAPNQEQSIASLCTRVGPSTLDSTYGRLRGIGISRLLVQPHILLRYGSLVVPRVGSLLAARLKFRGFSDVQPSGCSRVKPHGLSDVQPAVARV